MAFTAVELIEAKRDGRELGADAIEWLLTAYTDGGVPDYQMSAMAMAIFLNGMTAAELSAWTTAMLHSGEVLDLAKIAAAKVDKHSTGGVGDMSVRVDPLGDFRLNGLSQQPLSAAAKHLGERVPRTRGWKRNCRRANFLHGGAPCA